MCVVNPPRLTFFHMLRGLFEQGLMIHFSPPLSLSRVLYIYIYIYVHYIYIVNTVQDSKIVYDTQCTHAYLHMILLPACS